MISKSNFESKRSETKRSHCLTVVPRDVATRLIKYQRSRSVVFPPRPCTGHTSHRLRFAARHPNSIRWCFSLRWCSCVRVGAVIIISYRIAPLRKPWQLSVFLPASECVSVARQPAGIANSRAPLSIGRVPLKQCNKWFLQFLPAFSSKCLTNTRTHIRNLPDQRAYVCAWVWVIQQQYNSSNTATKITNCFRRSFSASVWVNCAEKC